MAKETTYVKITGVFKHETAKAFLFDIDEHGENWIPKSQCKEGTDFPGKDKGGELYVSEWLATKNGWA